MFEQSLVDASGAHGTRPWAVPAAAGGQMLLVGIALAIPLIYTEMMPGIRLVTPMVPFKAVAPPEVRPVQQHQAAPSRTRVPVISLASLIPRIVPDRIAIITEGPIEIATNQSPDGSIIGVPYAGPAVSSTPAVAPPPDPKKADPPKKDPPPTPSGPVPVGGIVKQPQLITYVKPVYPPLARQARIQGQVRISAILARDGSVTSMQLVSGHPLLVQAALDAVRLWRYRPTTLNGQPVEVAMSIDVNFTLSQ